MDPALSTRLCPCEPQPRSPLKGRVSGAQEVTPPHWRRNDHSFAPSKGFPPHSQPHAWDVSSAFGSSQAFLEGNVWPVWRLPSLGCVRSQCRGKGPCTAADAYTATIRVGYGLAPGGELGAAISRASPAVRSDLAWGPAPFCGPATPCHHQAGCSSALLSGARRPTGLELCCPQAILASPSHGNRTRNGSRHLKDRPWPPDVEAFFFLTAIRKQNKHTQNPLRGRVRESPL